MASESIETLGLHEAKPIIGLAGGIGSGKSTVARQMGRLGGLVIEADALARQALDRPQVRTQLVDWWGEAVLGDDGRINRRNVARIVFESEAERRRLEGLIHPIVAQRRQQIIDQARSDPAVHFIVLDVPLLFEVGLDKACDTVVFVRADRDVRLRRVMSERGWDEQELARREKNQWPLDRKVNLSHYIIDNNGSETECSAQVRDLLNRILTTS